MHAETRVPPGGTPTTEELQYYHSTTQAQDELIRTALGACDARVAEIEREVADFRLACSVGPWGLPCEPYGALPTLLKVSGGPEPRRHGSRGRAQSA